MTQLPTLAGLWVFGLLMLMGTVQANELLQINGQFRSTPTVFAQTPTSLHLPPTLPNAARGLANTIQHINLTPLSATERQQFQPSSANATQGMHIGIGRVVVRGFGLPTSWQWQDVPHGKAALLSITSPDAERVRMQLRFAALPPGTELRFYAPNDPATVYGPYTPTDMTSLRKDGAGYYLFWSPSVSGNTLNTEIFLPANQVVSNLNFEVPQVSHVVLEPTTGETQTNTLVEDTSCYSSTACANPAMQTIGKSVAKYLYTDEKGATFTCSGTLLNSTTHNSEPYFLTAHHCLDTVAKIASLQPIWFYSESQCGSQDAAKKAYYGPSGGQLLIAQPWIDMVFIYLRTPLPADVYLSGWSAVPFQGNEAVVGIHHAYGWPQMASQGIFRHFAKRINNPNGTFDAIPDPYGTYIAVDWFTGATAAGASGSGLWTGDYLTGTLLGGTASCMNQMGVSVYGRFDLAYPALQHWLNPTLPLTSTPIL